MKKRKILGILLLLLASVCSISAMAQTRAKTKARTTAPTFIMTEAGLDAIKLGMDYKTLPKSVAGLYDRYEVSSDESNTDNSSDSDYFSITFITKDGTIEASAKKTGEISYIFVSTKRVKVKIGDTLIGVGSKFSKLKNLPGAVEETFGEVVIGKFRFTQDIGMEEATDNVAYFILRE